MPEKNEEQFVQSRLLVASLLSAAAIMGYFYFFAPPPGAPIESPIVQEAPAPETSAPAPTPAAPVAAEEETAAAPPEDEGAEAEVAAVAATSERAITVDTGAYRVVFTNRGAAVKSWTLHHYMDAEGGELDLVNDWGAEEFGAPFSLRSPGGAVLEGVDDALFAVNDGPDLRTAPTELRFDLVQNGLRVTKTFRFEASGYVFELETRVARSGAEQPHRIAWPGGFGDFQHKTNETFARNFFFTSEEGLEDVDLENEEDGWATIRGRYDYLGIRDHYFAAIFLPEENETELAFDSAGIEVRPDAELEDTLLYPAMAIGGPGANRFRVFVGPKDVDELQAVDPRLREAVDFGWFGFIGEPLFLMMRWIHANWVANWGWAIVILTCFINLALFPLKWKGSKSMKRMQQIQPLVKQINERYKGLGMTDPKKQKQNEELMALYKKYDVNPAGGCFPMMLQIPFFFAFYTVLTAAIEMRGADWLWVSDLSQPETLAIRVLPLAMIATQFWMQSLTPTPSVDPAQAKMMKFMPLFMGFIFYQFQAGLVLYWLTSNLVGVGQQVLLNKMPGEPLEIEKVRPKGKKKK